MLAKNFPVASQSEHTVLSFCICPTKTYLQQQQVLRKDRHLPQQQPEEPEWVKDYCASQRAQGGSRASYPIGYYHKLVGKGGKKITNKHQNKTKTKNPSQLITQHKK